MIDETHDPNRMSWVDSANGHPDFPIQNLPFGVFSPPGGETRIGIAIGDKILDLRSACRAGLFAELGTAVEAALGAEDLAPLMAAGPEARKAIRALASDLLAADAPAGRMARDKAGTLLVDATQCTMHLPCAVPGFSDFFGGIHHAANAARTVRPDGTLWPNYYWMPVAYNGRPASIRPSGTDIVRPHGQRRAPDGVSGLFGPATMLDYEFELGIWIGTGSPMGEPVPIKRAADHIFGFSLLNDWSVRDTQMWENQPLGPFLSKNALTSVSCWLVTPEALAPFRAPMTLRTADDPPLLDYLSDRTDQAVGGLDIQLETFLLTPRMREADATADRIASANSTALYWSPAQMIAHLTSIGGGLRSGEVLGTGTISALDRSGFGSIIELTDGGQQPLTLPSGEQRSFLEDGDRVILRGRCARPGFVGIGFGANEGTVLPARAT